MNDNGWVKLHRKTLLDAKLRSLAPSRRWLFVTYIAAAEPIGKWRGYLLTERKAPMTTRQRANTAGMSHSNVIRGEAELLELGLIQFTDYGVRVKNYTKYQDPDVVRNRPEEALNAGAKQTTDNPDAGAKQTSSGAKQTTTGLKQTTTVPEFGLIQTKSCSTPTPKNYKKKEEEGRSSTDTPSNVDRESNSQNAGGDNSLSSSPETTDEKPKTGKGSWGVDWDNLLKPREPIPEPKRVIPELREPTAAEIAEAEARKALFRKQYEQIKAQEAANAESA